MPAVPDRLKPILEELQGLEPLFHAACRDASPDLFELLVAPEFWEVGASGRRYSRAFALEALEERRLRPPGEEEWRTREFHVSEISADSYALTYTLVQPGRVTRRLTLWRRMGNGWQALYHQGTIVTDPV